MDYRYRRTYCGPVRAVVTDWAGTTIDFGSCAPAGAFVDLFARNGVEASAELARGPMGLHKRDHIRAMQAMPPIAAAWRDAHGADWTVADLDRLYEQFTPLQVQCLPNYGDLVPGVADAVDRLRARGVAVAATTGYNSEMAAVVREEAARQGFTPDASVCASDVAAGRPAPWMVFRALEALDVPHPEAAVCVGDTIPDIESGLNAGAWSVGVAATGNMLGLTRAGYEALDESEREARLHDARKRMYAAGAHYVVDAFPDLVALLDTIDERLRRGEKP